MSWQDKINTVWQGDCLELMKEMPDKCIDLVVTDPPYGIGIDGSDASYKDGVQIRKEYAWGGWDTKIPSKDIFEEIKRVSKNQIIFGANYFNEYLEQGHKGWIIWDKGQRDLTMSDCEIIYSSIDKPTRIITVHRSHLWAEKPQHPTQKPKWLVGKIVEDNSKEGDLILDPFMGSWTTARACMDLGRNFIGAELSPEYCEIGKQRLRQQVLI